MEKEKMNELSTKLMSNKENYMDSFKKNVDMYVKHPDLTIRELAEKAGIPFSTINNFLYNNVSDMKLSTAISLARALGVSIDELVGCETLPESTRKAISSLRLMPERSVYLIEWFIKHQLTLHQNSKLTRSKFISVMNPTCKDDGEVYPSNSFSLLDISPFSDEIKSKVFFGLHIMSDHYMPAYSPYDTLLLANDRPAHRNEHCVIIYYGKLFIVNRYEFRKNCKKKIIFRGLFDDHFVIDEQEADEVIGYIADVYHDTSFISIG